MIVLLSLKIKLEATMHKTEGLVKCLIVSLVLYGHNSYQKESSMATAKICAYPPSQHAFPHWKYVLHCYVNCPQIDLPSQ